MQLTNIFDEKAKIACMGFMSLKKSNLVLIYLSFVYLDIVVLTRMIQKFKQCRYNGAFKDDTLWTVDINNLK